jgi:hypothetical protein
MRAVVVTSLELCVVVQLCLAFGVAGLLWPEKFMPLFELLLFPWIASHKMIRANCLAAIGISVLLLASLLVPIR